MIPLLKIRIKYIKGHLTSFITYNIIIPIFLLIAGLVIKSVKEPDLCKKTNSYANGEYYLFKNENQKYKNILYFFDEISLISKDSKECKELAEFMKKEANQTIFPMEKAEFKCYRDEKDLPYDEDGILIIKNNDKYEFQLIKHNSYILFDYRIISTENNIDLFNVDNLELIDKSDYNNKYSIYLELQSLLAKYLIQKKTGKPLSENYKNMIINLGANPYPEHTNFYLNLGQNSKNRILLIYLFIISFTFSLYSYFFNMRIIEEKEQKLDLFLRRNGASYFYYILSWFIIFFCMNFILSIGFCVLWKDFFPYHLLLFVFNIVLYIISLFSVTYFFYVCLPSTRIGNTIIKFYNLGLPVLGCAIIIDFIPRYAKIIFAIIPQINLFHCAYSIAELQTFKNINFEKLWLKANKVAYFDSIIMYFIDICLYLILSLLIKKARELNININYCKKNEKKNKVIRDDLLIQNEELNHPITSEKKNKHGQSNMKLLNIKKNYGDIDILNNFNAEFYKDEIFCILGNNGSGKSTLINIISGIEKPNKGDIIYNGVSLLKNKLQLYSHISSCQQDNLFFEFLSVVEHLELIQELKTGGINHEVINNVIKDLDLLEKQDYPCGLLSDGQKRKLCVALTLINDSPIIILDEPTSGMDMEIKRKFWQILSKYKRDKIIIITTHSLEEVECLGDRIGIISDGYFICSGSISYLKENIPCGFTINIIFDNKGENNEENKIGLINKIKSIESTIVPKIDYNGIVSINIKTENANMPKIFKCIEDSKNEFGIEDYIFNSTSLKDIFIKYNENNSINEDIQGNENYVKTINNNINTKNFISQLKSQIKRILILLKRNIIIFIIELIFSIFAVIIIFLLVFKKWMKQMANQSKDLDFFTILEANKNYVFDKNDYLKNSYAYKSSGYIQLDKIKKEPSNITEFMELAFKNSYSNIAKGSIYIKKNETNENIIEVYNTEIYTGNYGNVYANTMLLVSAFLKNEYNIDASLLTKIKYDYISTAKLNYYDILRDGFNLSIIDLCAVFGFLFFLTGLTNDKINDRKNNIKRLIYLNGGNMWSYWISYLIIDLIKIMIFTSLVMISISSINNSGGYIWANMIFISISSLFFIYFISYFCSKEDSVIKISFLFILIDLGIGYFFQSIKVEKNYPNLVIKKFLFSSFDLNPISSMGFSILRIFYNYCVEPTLVLDPGLRPITLAFWNSFVSQLFNFIVFGGLFLLVEIGYLDKILHFFKNIFFLNEKIMNKRKLSDFNIDSNLGPLLSKSVLNSNLMEKKIQTGISMGLINDDLEQEEEVKLNCNIINDDNNDINPFENESDNDNLINKNKIERKNSVIYKDPFSNQYVLNELNKIKNDRGYLTRIETVKKSFILCCNKKVTAVNKLCLGLELNEKFGLLGLNGSGKTTTFKMLINELLYDTGDINLFGYNNQNFSHLKSIIGYCPQENPLFESMKVKEIINFFSGIKTNNQNIEEICKTFGLTKYIDTFCCNLSGGNKRKLAFAIALMNKPNLLLLDEPSTGMDIITKKNMLNIINSTIKDNNRYNLILSIESADEVEYICDRVCWFNNGNFTYVGNPKDLKTNAKDRYKFYIKFDQSKFSTEQNISNKKYNEIINDLSNSIKLFCFYSDFFMNNPELEPQLEELYSIINKIKEDINNIELNVVGKDNSYEFHFEIHKEHQYILYSQLIEIKNKSSNISEIYIGKDSLESLLSSFK